MVQQPGEAEVDACPSNHQPDLDDPLPDPPRQLRLRVRPGGSGQGRLEGRLAICDQLVANLLFMPIFARLRSVPLAAGDILIVWATIIWLMAGVWPL